jgi:hypothetical protein
MAMEKDRCRSSLRSKNSNSNAASATLACCFVAWMCCKSKLARDEPLLYRELDGICTLRPKKRVCALDLTDGFEGMRWDEWWLYSPNSAMLTTIGALQKCRHRRTTTARALLVVFSFLKSNGGLDDLPRWRVRAVGSLTEAAP